MKILTNANEIFYIDSGVFYNKENYILKMINKGIKYEG